MYTVGGLAESARSARIGFADLGSQDISVATLIVRCSLSLPSAHTAYTFVSFWTHPALGRERARQQQYT